MTDRQLMIQEELHVFRREGMKRFSHWIRPRWSHSPADETLVKDFLTDEDVLAWLKHAKEPLTLDEQYAAVTEIAVREKQDPLHIFRLEEEEKL